MEADLRRFYGVRLSDMWRRDERGVRLLTMREAFNYLRHLPRDSALAIDDNGGVMPWLPTETLLADLWELQANTGRKGKPKIEHSGRKKQNQKQLEHQAARKKGAFDRAKARDARRRARAAS